MKFFASAGLGGAVAVLACLSACVSDAQQPVGPFDSPLDSIAQSWIAKDRNVGAVVAVVKGSDTLLFKSYGKADVEANVAMPKDAIIGIGSITKEFTAAAILKLRDAGKLSLDDDITRWLPDYDTGGHRIPLRQMLDHTSAIPDVSEIDGLAAFLRDQDASRDSMYAVIRRHPPESAGGRQFAYSNTAYWLLHLVVEKASGMPWERYLDSTFFEPLGMTSTGICFGPGNIPPRRAKGYGVRNGRVRPAPENVPMFYMGSGVLCSSATDMLTWLEALHGNKVLPPATYAEMTTRTVFADGTLGRGLGLEIGKDTHGNYTIGHSGELAGYTARANWYPDAKLAIVVLINNSIDSSPTAMAADLAAAVLKAR
jgi:CubicO group peptidase (beta-lactamase class C family)